MTGKESGSCDASPPTDFTTRLPLLLPATQPADRQNILSLSIHMALVKNSYGFRFNLLNARPTTELAGIKLSSKTIQSNAIAAQKSVHFQFTSRQPGIS